MDDDVWVVLGPRRSRFWRWLPFLGGRVHGGWNALWLTDEEIVIANSKETHVVPRAGASAVVDTEEQWPVPQQDWDNNRLAMRCLFIVPGDTRRDRIQVEAAEGLTPKKLIETVNALNAALGERP